ncbi:FAD-dependent monooxygenase [Kribbella kalugense]|uniref:2-polyprenyl-6-methoxyphenol hydroxylase-like FAD-dependent oxidoreductase n=1 Tax=Kribbella kalugense TaxID=2512221 RepID=A0A4R7ZTS8_9ACTN|nr:FAD-dependent monooxygenase [Kribbella kalugense]TDW18930.1 2-polyprenyl-6-methoxyphenol hydroxylase-like FAD-dependent oxidoreductase [Kribbella kalugense]
MKAVVVGASLSGLMTGLALSRAGVDATILERVDEFPRTGASLGWVPEGRLERITGRKGGTRASVQTWTAVHARLRAAVDADPHIELRHNTYVRGVDQDDDGAWATTSNDEVVRGDVVIGADGHRSVVRRSVAPEHPNATFAGYVLWIGLIDESAIPARHRLPRDMNILRAEGNYLFGYPLPRQLGWGWFDASRNELLRETGCVVGNVVQHSLAAADIPEATLHQLGAEASELWPALWRDVILDCIERRAVIGTPIAEYVPDRLVRGRLALVGDAAHVPTPMTGSGFSASLDDAEALADAVAAGVLLEYEQRRLSAVRDMVQSGQQFSRSFAS